MLGRLFVIALCLLALVGIGTAQLLVGHPVVVGRPVVMRPVPPPRFGGGPRFYG
ncbi:hypothetical protein COOONC_06202 [Cooperia oncophora]